MEREDSVTSAGKRYERARAKRKAQEPLRRAYDYGRSATRAELEAKGFVELASPAETKKIAAASGSKLWSELRAESPRPFDAKGSKNEVWIPLWVLVTWNATRRGLVEAGPILNRDWRNFARALLARSEDTEAVEAAHRLGGLEAATAVLVELGPLKRKAAGPLREA